MYPTLLPSAEPLVVSYIGLRRAIGASGLALPVLLGPLGWLLFGIDIQDNISSYYHTPLRDVFVGTLFSLGIFLYCYRGHDWIENWTANLGCIFALGVALCPLDANSDPLHQTSVVGYLHSLFGGLFFITLAFYSLVHFPISQAEDTELEPHQRQRNFAYRMSGIVILASTMLMGGYLFLLPSPWKALCDKYNLLFWLEGVAVWSFAAAWLTKGRVIVADVMIDLLATAEDRLLHRKK